MNNPPIARLLALSRLISSAWRVRLARGSGARLGVGCIIGQGSDLFLGLHAPRTGRIDLSDGCELCQGVILHPYGGSIVLGKKVYIGPHSVVYGHGGVEIDENTLIAMQCRILSSNHTIPACGTLISSCPDVAKPVRVGADCWLGAGVTVLGGVTIGDHCVVGAGAVVTRDLPPGSIAMGVPAKVVRMRPL